MIVFGCPGLLKGDGTPGHTNLPTRRATGRATRSRGSPGGKRRVSQAVLRGRGRRRGRRGSSRGARSISFGGTGGGGMIGSKNSSASSSGLGAGCKLEGRDSISNNGSRWAKLITNPPLSLKGGLRNNSSSLGLTALCELP